MSTLLPGFMSAALLSVLCLASPGAAQGKEAWQIEKTEIKGVARHRAEGLRSYKAASARIDSLLTKYPKILKKVSIGKSVQERELFVLRLTLARSKNVPEVYVGSGMHGFEDTQKDLLWMLTQLLERTDQPPVRDLLSHCVLWLQPMMNPDGTAAHTRWNANGVDLNRNFGHGFKKLASIKSTHYQGPAPFSEPETQAIRDFLKKRSRLRAYVDLHRQGHAIVVPYYGGDTVPACRKARQELNVAMENYDKRKEPWRSKEGGFSIDWVWGELGVMAFTLELSADDRTEPLTDYRMKALLHVLQKCGEYEREPRKEPLPASKRSKQRPRPAGCSTTKGQRACVTPPDRHAVLSSLIGEEFEDRSGELGPQRRLRIVTLFFIRTGTHCALADVPIITNPSVFPVRSDGDAADLYRRITGKKHPTLKGELSEDYKAFLEGNER